MSTPPSDPSDTTPGRLEQVEATQVPAAYPLSGALPSRRFLLTAGAGAVVTGASLAWLRSAHGPAGEESSTPSAVVTPGVTIYPQGQRPAVRRITGRLLDGGDYDSSAGPPSRAVVYNVWASWCGPCRKEATHLARAAEALRPNQVRFLGINLRDDNASAVAFERRYAVPYPSIASTDAGEALLAFGRSLPPNAIPMTMIVDGASRLGARIVGPTTFTTLRETVGTVLEP